jgi:hypothetical protein
VIAKKRKRKIAVPVLLLACVKKAKIVQIVVAIEAAKNDEFLPHSDS